MLRITIDTNILVDLESGAVRSSALRAILDGRVGHHCQLLLPAIMASELQVGGKYLDDFRAFVQRANAVGFDEASLLPVLGYWGVAFWGHALWSSEESVRLERAIHEVLFDQQLYTCPDELSSDFKRESPRPEYVAWRNAKCDVLALWCHIHHGCDVFVTADRNFHKATKKAKLIELGAKRIVWPEEVDAELAASRVFM